MVPKGLDHTLSVITISLYVCVHKSGPNRRGGGGTTVGSEWSVIIPDDFLEKWSQPPTPLGWDHFSKKFLNCHILLLTRSWGIAQSIKRAVATGKVHLPIKSIEKIFIFGPYLRNRALFQKSVKSLEK